MSSTSAFHSLQREFGEQWELAQHAPETVIYETAVGILPAKSALSTNDHRNVKNR